MKWITYLLFLTLLFLGAAFTCKAQVMNYETEWKKVDELIQKSNLPQSALTEVKKIYARAKEDKQDAQIIKALVYMTSLQQENREDNQIQVIKEIEKEITLTKEPAVSVLKSYLADLYWQYFQNHRWQLYGRTNTTGFNKEDIATWTAEDFHKKIGALYLESISNNRQLKQTLLTPFDAIIQKGNVRYLRPTLYDLLAHKALAYFKNDERDIKKPAYAFEISQPEAFAPAASFATHSFTTQDSLSLAYKALLIYQDLIAFHLNDEKTDALIDVDIDRIQYVYSKSVHDDKDSLYTKALASLIAAYKDKKATYQAQYLLAAYYNEQANLYSPLKDTTHQSDRIKAKEILEKIVRDSGENTEGWVNSYNLLKGINQKTFSFQIEKVNIPNQPFRALVNYKNIASLHFRLIKADEALQKQIEKHEGDESYWNSLIKAEPIRSWQQTVPLPNDLQQHSAEIKIDALPIGEYVLLASYDQPFDKKSALGAQLFYVSGISYVNQGEKFFVLHRESGKPLVQASVQVFKQEYDYKNYTYNKVKTGTYQTDKDGYFAIKKTSSEPGSIYFLDISYQNDRLALNEPSYQEYWNWEGRPYNPEDYGTPQIFFFTDRSIYRPGQTVYFKGILLSVSQTSKQIAPGYKTTIYLSDVNNQRVDSITVTTNEFGSFSGRFQIPQNVLTGRFSIHDDKNEYYFSVEEYKRPKFYVDFEKVKNSYKVSEVVNITGFAKAYAGNNIDGAKVSYRVVRQPRFIYPWRTRQWWLPQAAPMEIAHGETTTDKNGQFNIAFTAIPDKEIDKRLDPLFDYRIYVDITDINGETRSNNHIITAGYKSLLLRIGVAERLAVDSLKNISIRTENMNSEFQPATVTVSFTRLIPESRLIRNRLWQQPDQFVMSREEYIRNFPHDEYKNETDYTSWEKGETVFTKTDSAKINSEFSIIHAGLKAGFYEITVTTKDKDGQEVTDRQYTELFDPNENSLGKPAYLWTKGSERPIEPGEKTTIQLGTSAASIFVFSETDKEKGNIDNENKSNFEFSTLNSGRKTWSFGATEEDRGGYGVNFFFVKDNRFYQFSDVINVPWSNKELNIEYETFRDKTLPGSEEKWKVKITGYKNEKIAAEMLASMYDASLDQFSPHEWSRPYLYPLYTTKKLWASEQNFSAIQARIKWTYLPGKNFIKQYDYLNLYVNNRSRNDYRGMYSKVAAPAALEGRAAGIQLAAPGAADVYNEVVVTAWGRPADKMVMDSIATKSIPEEEQATDRNSVQPRKNFNETAFFFPELRTDENGAIEFSFTAPEALTKWKLQTLAHTKDLAFGLSSKELITQKELMVQPNAPRFLRQGDQMEFSAKIVNLSDKEYTGQAQLQLLDASTNKPVDGWFINTFPNQYFTVAAGQSEVVNFPIQVPYQYNSALVWRIIAKSGKLSDGEENVLPVLSNKVLVTETLPLPMRGTGSKAFQFEKLLHDSSETLQNHSLTVEYTSNPAWYVVQALPYLMEYPYECAEQTWNRYYANALATKIANASPRIKKVFENWKEADTCALLSNLEKNQELKSALLEETPWVMQAKTETEQKKNIALLFDMLRMNKELKSNLEKLKQMQSPNGGFVWFKGGPDDHYITQYIIAGIGHLKKLGGETQDLNRVLSSAIPYLDKKLKERYDRLIKNKADLSKQQLGYLEIQYLYTRSFFPEYPVPQAVQTAYNFYYKQAQKYWTTQNKLMQGMTALTLYRSKLGLYTASDKQTATAILNSLKETALYSEEMGMYWKDNRAGYSWFWWFAPIETQSLLIEAFSEIGNNQKAVDNMKTWLIKNKQTTSWRTTKATADACYAVLLQGTDWLSKEPVVQVQLGKTIVSSNNQKTEAGTGYFTKSIDPSSISPDMGKITVQVSDAPSGAPSWGAVYWQYFEDMDKITAAATPLQLSKKLFIETLTDRGPALTPVQESSTVHVGDKIKVHIELRADRDMEYVHMKDMRASALEPVNVLSSYKWQGGLGYYEATKDASTNFFFSYLPKGTYVFEYTLFATHAGSFSNGITSIQCMYAPEFTAHSEGQRIRIE